MVLKRNILVNPADQQRAASNQSTTTTTTVLLLWSRTQVWTHFFTPHSFSPHGLRGRLVLNNPNKRTHPATGLSSDLSSTSVWSRHLTRQSPPPAAPITNIWRSLTPTLQRKPRISLGILKHHTGQDVINNQLCRHRNRNTSTWWTCQTEWEGLF